MEQRFFLVEDTFKLEGRNGLVIAGILEENSPSVRVGDCLKILRPDNVMLLSKVTGIEFVSRKCFARQKTISLLIENLSKDDVVKGSNVYLVKD